MIKHDIDSLRPTIIIDSREQAPLVFTKLPYVIAGLVTGDYSAIGMEQTFVIERKSVADIVSCCMGENRERFERELQRMRGYRFRRLLIIGTVKEIEAGEYRSEIKPKSVLHTIWAFEMRYETPVVFVATPEEGAGRVESWAFWHAREIALEAERMNKFKKECINGSNSKGD